MTPPAAPSTAALEARAIERTGTPADRLRVATAPTTGRFEPAVRTDSPVRAGAVIGWITGGRGRADEVRAPAPGVVRGLLARSGQLVQARRALVWIESA